MSVGDWDVTDDGNVLAYTTDNTGFRDYTLHVKDLDDRQDSSPETVPKVSSIAWAADNKTLFYANDDAAKRPYRIYRHILGADPKTDALVYEEKDEMYRVGVSALGQPEVPLPRSPARTRRRVADPAGGPADGRRGSSSRLAKRSTSTTSTTAATCSTSGPTAAAAATSAS